MRYVLPTFAVMLLFYGMQARAACVPVAVRYDAKAEAVEATVTLPKGVTSLTLRDLSPYHRRTLWSSPDGSAQIGQTTLAASKPDQRELHLRMDVHADAPIEDRAYAPWLRFADGTVAIYAPLFLAPSHGIVTTCPRWVPAAKQQVIGYGRAQAMPLETDMAAPEGYVAFGQPAVQRHGDWMLVSDRGAPAWVRQRIVHEVPALVELYRRSMAPAKVPMLFVFSRPTPHGARDFKGDHLPASITLGLLGDAWDRPGPEGVDRLTGFLAHELFHSWNSDALLGSPEGEALLAKEGGADLAKIFAVGRIGGESSQSVWDAIAQSYNACLLTLPRTQSMAKALGDPQPGAMPYVCGAALMSALAVAADPADPVQGYFGLWRALRQAHVRQPHDGYRWQDLIPPSLAPDLRETLARSVAQPAVFASGLQRVWTDLGVKVTPLTTPDPDTRRAYAARLLMHLMAADCGGSVSLWNTPAGFRLDQPLPRCHHLHPGALVDAIQGESLAHADPLALAKRVQASCATGGTVTIGYAAEHGTPAPADSPIVCTAPLSLPPAPVRLNAPVH